MNRLILMAFLCVAAVFGIGAGAQWYMQRGQAGAPPPLPGQHGVVRFRSAASGGQQTEIQRDGSGQFHMTAQVNGEDTRFLVDTGADVVALTLEDAKRAGIDADPSTFEPIMQTASGVANGARVSLSRIEIGGEEFQDVDAVVMDALPVSLLGQSVLRRMGKVELRGDSLVIQRQS